MGSNSLGIAFVAGRNRVPRPATGFPLLLKQLYAVGVLSLAIIVVSGLFIGMVLMAIRLLILMWGVFTGKNEGFTLADEAKESMHLAEETKASANLSGGDSA